MIGQNIIQIYSSLALLTALSGKSRKYDDMFAVKYFVSGISLLVLTSVL